MKKENIAGAMVERGKIVSVSNGVYTVESLDRDGITALPTTPVHKETYLVGDIVYFFVHEDGTGRIVSKVEGYITTVMQSDIVNNVATDSADKVVSAAVAKMLNDKINQLISNLALQTIASGYYKATSTNYEYVNISFTVPAGATYLVWVAAVYQNGAPIGVALANSDTTLSASTIIHRYETDSSLPSGNTPVWMLVGGTYYLWVKRANVPVNTNIHYVYGVILKSAS